MILILNLAIFFQTCIKIATTGIFESRWKWNLQIHFDFNKANWKYKNELSYLWMYLDLAGSILYKVPSVIFGTDYPQRSNDWKGEVSFEV